MKRYRYIANGLIAFSLAAARLTLSVATAADQPAAGQPKGDEHSDLSNNPVVHAGWATLQAAPNWKLKEGKSFKISITPQEHSTNILVSFTYLGQGTPPIARLTIYWGKDNIPENWKGTASRGSIEGIQAIETPRILTGDSLDKPVPGAFSKKQGDILYHFDALPPRGSKIFLAEPVGFMKGMAGVDIVCLSDVLELTGETAK